MGERGSGSRHGGLCGREHSPLVALDGESQLSASQTPVDYSRFRRQQRRTGEAVEVGITETGRRNRAGDIGLSLPAGHEQVEQDRTSAVLFHQPELAGQTAHQSRSHYQPYSRHYHRHWPGGEKQARHQHLSCGIEGFRPTDGRTPAQERQVSWRLELQSSAQKLTQLFPDRPLVISFMTRAELLLWPAANDWGLHRRNALEEHTALYLTLYPDE